MLIQNAIMSFPTLFTPKRTKNAAGQETGDPKYSVQILISPHHPQFQQINAEFESVKAAGFPSGLPRNADVCWAPYDEKIAGKDYYDPRCSGWYVLSANATVDSKPAVVNTANEMVFDPGLAYSGQLAHIHVNIYSFMKGNTGVACGLNGVMLTGVDSELGRLDNKPTVEQMFAGVGGAPQQHQPAAVSPAPGRTVAPPPQRTVAPPPQQQVKRLLPHVAGTYEEHIAQGWTDALLVQHGMMAPPVTASFQ